MPGRTPPADRPDLRSGRPDGSVRREHAPGVSEVSRSIRHPRAVARDSHLANYRGPLIECPPDLSIRWGPRSVLAGAPETTRPLAGWRVLAPSLVDLRWQRSTAPVQERHRPAPRCRDVAGRRATRSKARPRPPSGRRWGSARSARSWARKDETGHNDAEAGGEMLNGRVGPHEAAPQARNDAGSDHCHGRNHPPAIAEHRGRHHEQHQGEAAWGGKLVTVKRIMQRWPEPQTGTREACRSGRPAGR